MGLFDAGDRRSTVIAWTYVGVQFVLLVAILMLPPGDAWVAPPWLSAVARVAQWVGVVALVVGLVNLGRSLTPLPTPVPHGELRTGGLYRLVRHPIYSGILALAGGSAARSGNPWAVVLVVALAGWFWSKARWEERRLADRYDGYADYCAATPRFVPLWPGHPAPGR